jgi:hypothetical protein
MEFLLVEFDEDRALVIDDTPTAWRTNQIAWLNAGPHVVALAPPANFTPTKIDVDLINTSVANPAKIKFDKV